MTTPALPLPATERPMGVADWLEAAFDEPRDKNAIVVATLPAPVAPLESLLDADPNTEAVLWHPADGPAFAALGAVETLVGSGPDRMEQIREQARALLGRVVTASPDLGAPSPRCFGGFAFQAGWAREEPWSEFGDARFVFPRFTYARTRDAAFLSVALRGDEAASESRRRPLFDLAEALVGVLRSAAARGPHRAPAGPRTITSRVEATEAEFRALVEETRSRIERGDFQKVVVAGRTALSFAEPVDVTDVLSELAQGDSSTRFAFRFGKVTFLGATPERLIRVSGLDVDTEALAGSGDASRAAELFASVKERNEHEFVIREIVEHLAPLCSRLDFSNTPEVRTLRHLLHLRTPVRGKLAARRHVLELVSRLHPTSAVGGVPGPEAVRFITEHEPAERGWYAAPIGWFDRSGDGEFVVGLRSGAFVGNRAYLYAGGGVVRGSDPASEYAETRLKLRTLSAALHVAK
ncbi:MAG TPA: isochorismate synthase [Polyangiaceae bacterium]|nr:isochorismate synthase [Polyangiaceae bacterium]